MNEQNDKKDKVIADSGWGIKPDDQPANAQEAAAANVYPYDPNRADVLKDILRAQRQGFNTATRVLIEPGKTTIFDLNGDGLIIAGLSFGDPVLVELLKTVGAPFDPNRFAKLGPDFDGVRDYRLTRAWAWGAEREG